MFTSVHQTWALGKANQTLPVGHFLPVPPHQAPTISEISKAHRVATTSASLDTNLNTHHKAQEIYKKIYNHQVPHRIPRTIYRDTQVDALLPCLVLRPATMTTSREWNNFQICDWLPQASPSAIHKETSLSSSCQALDIFSFAAVHPTKPGMCQVLLRWAVSGLVLSKYSVYIYIYVDFKRFAWLLILHLCRKPFCEDKVGVHSPFIVQETRPA